VALVATFGWKQLLQIDTWQSCAYVRFLGWVCGCTWLGGSLACLM